jgi:hypothetical protein
MKARPLGRRTTAGNDGEGMILTECVTEFEPTDRLVATGLREMVLVSSGENQISQFSSRG